MITLGLVDSVDDNGVYVTMPGSRGVLRGPYKALSTVAAGTTVLVASTDDGEQVVVGPVEGGDGAYSVLSFGAVGDDVADDTAAIQATIDAAGTVGGTVVVPPGVFKITDSLTITEPVRITGPGTIHQTASAHGLDISADDVTVDGITLLGRHSGSVSLDSDEDAIHAAGASASSCLSGTSVRNVTLSGWGMHGVYLRWVDMFEVTGCHIDRIGYGGVVVLSGTNGLVAENLISDIAPGSSGDMYGVALSRWSSASLVTDPRCSDVVVRANVVSGVDWEGLDTHAGQRITFTGNVIRDCQVGIAVVGSSNGTDTTWAAKDVVVTGNVIDSEVTDGSAGYGISVAGAPGATSEDPAVDYATCSVTGNVIRGHGDETATSGAVYARSTEGLVVSGNVFEQPSPFGVCLYYDNRGFTVVGNTVVDAWSDSVSVPGAVGSLAEYNIGTVAGNTLRTGAKTATYLNVNGVRNNAGTGTDITFGFNNFATATNICSASTGIQPVITGSRSANAALASLLTALDGLGLIVDNSS